jgi:transitional endoplasmic reticulum ATPase
MSAKSNAKAYFMDKLEYGYLLIFLKLPRILFFGSAVRLFWLWIYGGFHGKTLTFALRGKGTSGLSEETIIVLAAIGYQMFLNVVRYFVAIHAVHSKGFIDEPPFWTSYMLEKISALILTTFGVFFVFWISFGDKALNESYWLIGFLGAVTAFSLFISKFEWCYGLNMGDRTQIQHGHSDQQTLPSEVARKEKSKITFADILGNKEIKRRLLDAARAITDRKAAASRNGILLHGEPGNGKTIFAEALAGELKLPILKLTHSDVASRWVGERTEKIKAAFDQAIRSQPCVFFIDEIDSFIPDRSGAATQTKEDTDVVNSLLTLLVDIRKHKVVVMAATNYMDRLDGAAVREGRFDFKVEITPPDEEARVGFLTSGLSNNVKKVSVDPLTIQNVANRWNGFSVKRILAVTEELPSYLADLNESGRGKSKLEYEDFMAALRRIQGRRGSTPENVKPMADLILPVVTKEALDMLSSRLRDPQRVERLGGTLPTGVLFYGPPGTGKTAACKALAKEVDWAFLIATGTDLARDPKGLDKLFAQAKELRPCIVFIDEADDLIRSREYSNNTEATNKLLTIMDGVNDRVRDVVWIAATNHPDQIDQALLRGGRFTEKVEFVRPDENQLASHVGKWLLTRDIVLSPDISAQDIAELVGDESIANVEAVLQYAVNRAISKSAGNKSLELSADDIKIGAKMVLGAAC